MIGIIAASEEELKPILNHMQIIKTNEKALLKFHIGKIGTKDAVVLFSGACKVNAAIAVQLLINDYRPDIIYITGVAGALNKNLKIGDTLVIKSVAHHDVDTEILTEYHPFMKSIWYDLLPYIDTQILNKELILAEMITGEIFIKLNHKKTLLKKFKVHCVDMESAAFAQVCYANDVPVIIFKTITDYADKNGYDDFSKNVIQCSKKCAEKLLEYIKNS